MPFTEKNGIRYYQFESFPNTLTHAVFTRQGGVSPTPWHSLNFGGTVGDDLACVRENRQRAFAAVGQAPETIFDVWQVHGTKASFALQPRDPNAHEDQADIIFTDRPGISLFMRFADCTPLLFYDSQKNVIGLAHAGWMGTVRGVATAAVKAMRERYDSKPEDILAAIGPSIGPDHYEVGDDVIAQVHTAFGDDAEILLPRFGERRHFDLWAANRIELEKSGVTQIETASLCTICHPEDWYSHRGEKGKTGRFGALIALKE